MNKNQISAFAEIRRRLSAGWGYFTLKTRTTETANVVVYGCRYMGYSISDIAIIRENGTIVWDENHND